jgi:catalase
MLVKRAVKPEVQESEALSLFARPGDGTIRTRRVAILVADGVAGGGAQEIHRQLSAQGAVPRYVGTKLGRVESEDGEPIEVEVSMEAMPSVLWDGLVVADGAGAVEALSRSGHALEFLKDQYRHCKPILVLGAAAELLDAAGISEAGAGDSDPGLLTRGGESVAEAIPAFIAALARHRHFERETDPPRV